MRNMSLVLVLALVGTAPAMAETNRSGATKGGNKLICKRQPDTGTRFVKKVCHTKDQWERITEENKRIAAEMVTRSIETRRQ